MLCPRCNRECAEGSLFCSSCGLKLQQNRRQSPDGSHTGGPLPGRGLVSGQDSDDDEITVMIFDKAAYKKRRSASEGRSRREPRDDHMPEQRAAAAAGEPRPVPDNSQDVRQKRRDMPRPDIPAQDYPDRPAAFRKRPEPENGDFLYGNAPGAGAAGAPFPVSGKKAGGKGLNIILYICIFVLIASLAGALTFWKIGMNTAEEDPVIILDEEEAFPADNTQEE